MTPKSPRPEARQAPGPAEPPKANIWNQEENHKARWPAPLILEADPANERILLDLAAIGEAQDRIAAWWRSELQAGRDPFRDVCASTATKADGTVNCVHHGRPLVECWQAGLKACHPVIRNGSDPTGEAIGRLDDRELQRVLGRMRKATNDLSALLVASRPSKANAAKLAEVEEENTVKCEWCVLAGIDKPNDATKPSDRGGILDREYALCSSCGTRAIARHQQGHDPIVPSHEIQHREKYGKWNYLRAAV